MNITTTKKNDIIIIDLEGELDLFSAPLFMKEVKKAMEQGSIHFIVQLAKTTYVDSSGLGSLIQARKEAKSKDGDVAICCISPETQHIFELSKMNVFFNVFDTEKQTIEHFNNIRKDGN